MELVKHKLMKEGEEKKMEELKNIKVVIRWGKNGRKYVWEQPSQKKIIELINKYDYEQLCDGCLWLQR